MLGNVTLLDLSSEINGQLCSKKLISYFKTFQLISFSLRAAWVRLRDNFPFTKIEEEEIGGETQAPSIIIIEQQAGKRWEWRVETRLTGAWGPSLKVLTRGVVSHTICSNWKLEISPLE